MRKFTQGIFTAVLAVLLFKHSSFAQTQQEKERKERIISSYSIMSGREPSQGEIDHWMKQGELSVQQLVDYHRQYANNEASFKRDLITRSYKHALGRTPTEDEIKWWSQYNQTYTEMMKNHVNWLGNGNSEYDNVIKRSYKRVFNREPQPDELNWWKQQKTYSYAMLVACHKDYSKRNQSGIKNQITTTATDVMKAIPLSNPVVQQVKNIIGGTVGQALAPGAEAVQSVLGPFLPIILNTL